MGMNERCTEGDSGDMSALKDLNIMWVHNYYPQQRLGSWSHTSPNHILIHGQFPRYASKKYLPLSKSPYISSRTMLIPPSSPYNNHNPTPDPVPAPVRQYSHCPLSATYPVHTVPSPHPPPLAPQSPQVELR